jgi:hypothetical protein
MHERRGDIGLRSPELRGLGVLRQQLQHDHYSVGLCKRCFDLPHHRCCHGRRRGFGDANRAVNLLVQLALCNLHKDHALSPRH